uniref:Uncharacterized protein n=1 Tax=Rhizophora mucronata TaxID=61149 RepID=A0A2P2PZT4_RHIMU
MVCLSSEVQIASVMPLDCLFWLWISFFLFFWDLCLSFAFWFAVISLVYWHYLFFVLENC